jgi:hypothetical protein
MPQQRQQGRLQLQQQAGWHRCPWCGGSCRHALCCHHAPAGWQAQLHCWVLLLLLQELC